MTKNRKILFTTTDPEERSIVLYEDTWQQHITVGHPEISDIEEIKTTIRYPNVITKIATRTSIAYSKIGGAVPYVNVLAKMDDTYSKGTITTAYLSGKLPNGQAIWVRKKQIV